MPCTDTGHPPPSSTAPSAVAASATSASSAATSGLAKSSSQTSSNSSSSKPTRQGSQSMLDSFASSAKELIKEHQQPTGSQEASFLFHVDKVIIGLTRVGLYCRVNLE